MDGEGAGASGAYCEVYIDDFYGLRKTADREPPGTIVDIGANIGFFCCYARLKYPRTKIVAYEPNPEAFRRLETNARNCAIELHRSAVGRKGGMASFDAGPDSTLGRVTGGGALRVPMVATRRLAAGAPIDLLKMDCEGGEWDILEDRGLLRRTRRIVMEYHLTEGKTWEDLIALLAAGGHQVEQSRRSASAYGFLQSARRIETPGGP